MRGFVSLLALSSTTLPILRIRGQEQEKYDRLKTMEAEIKASGFAPVHDIAGLNEYDADGQTPLQVAAAAGQVDMIKSFLIAGAKANLVNAKGDTPLMSSVQAGHYHSSAQLLRAPSTDLFQRNNLGANVLHQAIAADMSVIVESILNTDMDRRANPDRNDVVNDEAKSGTLLVDTRLVGSSTQSGLMMAAQNGGTEIVRILLQHKAQVNIQTDTGETALMYAALMGNVDIVALLLAASARVDLVTHDKGFSALMMASSRGHVAVVDKLLEHAIETRQYHVLDIKDVAGQTALDHASDAREQQVMDRLVAAGADLGHLGAPHASKELLQERAQSLGRRHQG